MKRLKHVSSRRILRESCGNAWYLNQSHASVVALRNSSRKKQGNTILSFFSPSSLLICVSYCCYSIDAIREGPCELVVFHFPLKPSLARHGTKRPHTQCQGFYPNCFAAKEERMVNKKPKKPSKRGAGRLKSKASKDAKEEQAEPLQQQATNHMNRAPTVATVSDRGSNASRQQQQPNKAVISPRVDTSRRMMLVDPSI